MKYFLLTSFLLLFPEISQACSVCFYGDSDQAMSKGLRAGIFSLLVILVVVVGLFVKFFLNFQKRAKLLAEK